MKIESIENKDKNEFEPLEGPIENVEREFLPKELASLVMEKMNLNYYKDSLGLDEQSDSVVFSIKELELRNNANLPHYIDEFELEIPVKSLSPEGIEYFIRGELENIKFKEDIYSITGLRATCHAEDQNHKEIPNSFLDRNFFKPKN